jgi:uncharacterized protein involved in exopolysaccharide biosynthesis
VVIAVLVLAGLGVGLSVAGQQPSTYSATASLALQPVPKYVTPSTTELVAPEVTIDTDAQLLQSPEVLSAIGSALGTDADTAATRLSISASPNTHVLHVTIRSTSADRAAAAANAAAVALVRVRRDTLTALRLDQLRQMQLLVDSQERELARQQAGRLVIPATDDLFADLLQLRTDLEELEEARRAPALFVEAATPPRQADYANREVPVVSGAMLGLLAACLVGAGRDRLRLLAVRPRSARFHPSDRLSVATAIHEDIHHGV